MLKLSRRNLLKSSLIGAAALTVPLGAKVGANTLKDNKSADYLADVVKTQTWCEMCFFNCGVTAYTKNGRVFKLEGQKKCPNNYGSLCARGNSGIFQLHDPDRLKYPLIREGERGSGKFRRASWDEATAYIAEKLKPILDTDGPKAVSMVRHGTGAAAFINLFEIMGAKNIYSPSFSQCLGSREVAWRATFGKIFTGREAFEGSNSKAIMSFGRDMLGAIQVGEAKRITDAIDKGCKIIYVDPRYAVTAAKADYWLKIKPGTDLALSIGMIAYIIQNDLYDKEFIDKYAHGMAEMKEFYKDITLDWAAAETGIKKEVIIEIINVLVDAAPHCMIHPGRRVARYGDDTQMVRSIAILNALMGNYEMPGGLTSMQSLDVEMPPMVEFAEPDAEPYDRIDGARANFPLAMMGLTNKMMEGIISGQPYPTRAFFAYDTNLFYNLIDDDRIKEMLMKPELVVTCDIYLTETALYSDVILPEANYLERYDPIQAETFMVPFLQYREPAVKPMGELIGAWDIVKKISEAMKFDAKWLSIQEFNDAVMEDAGITPDELKEHGVWVDDTYAEDSLGRWHGYSPDFFTPTGKLELYSTVFANLGFSPFPEYTAHEQPTGDDFRFLTGRLSFHTHAKTQNLRPLLALQDYKVPLWIHTDRAKKLNIKDGDKVRVVQGKKRSEPMTAFVTDLIHESCVLTFHGFGRFSKFNRSAFAMKGASGNNFMSNVTDPISGAAGFHMAFVKVEKV